MKRRKLLGVLLAATCLVTTLPGTISATDLTLTKDQAEKAQERAETEPMKDKEKTEKPEAVKETEKHEPEKEEGFKNTAAGDTNGGKNPPGVYGSPDPTGEYDFTGVVPNDEPPVDFDRYAYDPQADDPALFGIESWKELDADIAKRSEWVD